MAIDRAQVKHVAHLARLELTGAEEERLAQQLSSVLGYVEQLSQVDVSGVEPLAFAGDASAGSEALLRPDEPQPGLLREPVLAQAPDTDGQTFLVPRILELE